MSGRVSRLIIRNLVSPVGLAVFSYSFFLFAWAFPPKLYTQLMREPDYMFLDWRSLFFCSLCVTAFLVGARVSRIPFTSIFLYLFGLRLTSLSPGSKRDDRSMERPPNYFLLALPLMVSAALGCVTLFVLGLKTDILTLLFDQQAQLIKDANAAGANTDLSFWGKLLPLAPIHMATIWWFAFRTRKLSIPRKTKWWMVSLLYFALLIAVANAIARVDRTALMPLLVGLLPVYVFTSSGQRTGRLWPILKPICVGAMGIVALFLLVDQVRGNTQPGDTLQMLVGYTFSSYNRLAALLIGDLRYDYTGNIKDICWFCSTNKYFNAVVPYAQYFHVPDPLMSWSLDFTATGASGLAGSYTFASAFAVIFRDIGWWAPLYFCCEGFIVGRAWQSFEAGRTFGLMLYPWCVFVILFWFGWEMLLYEAFFYICVGAVFMSGFERWLGKGTAQVAANRVLGHRLRTAIPDGGGD